MIFYYSERTVYADMFIEGLSFLLGVGVAPFLFENKGGQGVVIIDGYGVHPQRLKKVIRSSFPCPVILLSDRCSDVDGVTAKLSAGASLRDVARVCSAFFMECEGQVSARKFQPMEVEFLGDLVAGASNKEIARRYDIPLSRVKYHLQNIYQKMGVNNRTQAALKAREFIL